MAQLIEPLDASEIIKIVEETTEETNLSDYVRDDSIRELSILGNPLTSCLIYLDQYIVFILRPELYEVDEVLKPYNSDTSHLGVAMAVFNYALDSRAQVYVRGQYDKDRIKELAQKSIQTRSRHNIADLLLYDCLFEMVLWETLDMLSDTEKQSLDFVNMVRVRIVEELYKSLPTLIENYVTTRASEAVTNLFREQDAIL